MRYRKSRAKQRNPRVNLPPWWGGNLTMPVALSAGTFPGVHVSSIPVGAYVSSNEDMTDVSTNSWNARVRTEDLSPNFLMALYKHSRPVGTTPTLFDHEEVDAMRAIWRDHGGELQTGDTVSRYVTAPVLARLVSRGLLYKKKLQGVDGFSWTISRNGVDAMVSSGMDVGTKTNPSKKPRKASKGKKRAPRSKAYQIQSLMLDRETFTEASARAWLWKNRHAADRLSFSEDFIHAVQHPRGDYRKGTLHNIQIAKHVEATVGIPLSDSDAAEAPGYNKRGPRQQRLKLTSRGELIMGETYEPLPDTPF